MCLQTNASTSELSCVDILEECQRKYTDYKKHKEKSTQQCWSHKEPDRKERVSVGFEVGSWSEYYKSAWKRRVLRTRTFRLAFDLNGKCRLSGQVQKSCDQPVD